MSRDSIPQQSGPRTSIAFYCPNRVIYPENVRGRVGWGQEFDFAILPNVDMVKTLTLALDLRGDPIPHTMADGTVTQMAFPPFADQIIDSVSVFSNGTLIQQVEQYNLRVREIRPQRNWGACRMDRFVGLAAHWRPTRRSTPIADTKPASLGPAYANNFVVPTAGNFDSQSNWSHRNTAPLNRIGVDYSVKAPGALLSSSSSAL